MENKVKEENDDISIFSIFEIIQKNIITIFLLSVLFIGIIYFINYALFPTYYTSSIVVSPVNPDKISKYQSINEIDIFPDEYQPIISRKKIYEYFLSQVKEKDILYKSISENSSFIETLNSEQEKIDHANNHASNLFIKKNRDNQDTEISINYVNKKDIEAILKGVISNTNLFVAKSINTQIENLKRGAIKNKERKIRKLESEISTIKYNKNLSLETRINFLNEQLAIAKQLNLMEYIQPGTIVDLGSNIIDTFNENSPKGYDDNSFPYYTRGAKAIEEEINQLVNRKKNKNYVSNRLIDLKTELKRHQNKLDIDYMEESLKNVDFMNSDFTAVNTNLEFIKTSKSSSTIIFLLLSTLISIIVASILILIRDSYKKYLKKSRYHS